MKKYFCIRCSRSYDTSECPRHRIVIDDISTPEGYDAVYESVVERLSKMWRPVRVFIRVVTVLCVTIVVTLCSYWYVSALDGGLGPKIRDLATLAGQRYIGLDESSARLLAGFIALPIIGSNLTVPGFLVVIVLLVEPDFFLWFYHLVTVPTHYLTRFFTEKVLRVPFLLTTVYYLEPCYSAPYYESPFEYMKKAVTKLLRIKASPLTVKDVLVQKGLLPEENVTKEGGQSRGKRRSLAWRIFCLVVRILYYPLIDGLRYDLRRERMLKKAKERALKELREFRKATTYSEGIPNVTDEQLGSFLGVFLGNEASQSLSNDEFAALSYLSFEELAKSETHQVLLALIRSDPKHYKGLPKMVTNVLFFNLPWFEEWVLRKGKNVPPPWDERFLSQIPEGAKTKPVLIRPQDGEGTETKDLSKTAETQA